MCQNGGDYFEIEIDAPAHSDSESETSISSHTTSAFTVNLPPRETSCDFSDSFFTHIANTMSKNQANDLVCWYYENEPPCKRKVTVCEEALVLGDKGPQIDPPQESTPCPSKTSLLSNIESKVSEIPPSIENSENTQVASLKRKRNRRVKTQNMHRFLNTPPWFLDASTACFFCRRHMSGSTRVHLKHKPDDPIFPEASFLNESNARHWAVLFDKLIDIVQTHFNASSRAQLLEILNDKLRMPPRPLGWSKPMLHVLNVYHNLYYDAVKPENVILYPANSLKVLADELYFFKLLEISDRSLKVDINKL